MYLCRGFLNSGCSLDVKVGFFGQLRQFLGFHSRGLSAWSAGVLNINHQNVCPPDSSHPSKSGVWLFIILQRQTISSSAIWSDLCSIDVNVVSCMLRSSRVQEAERHTFDTILLIPVEARGDPLAGRPNYMFWTPARYSEFL
jgi:hypothetical protein